MSLCSRSLSNNMPFIVQVINNMRNFNYAVFGKHAIHNC